MRENVRKTGKQDFFLGMHTLHTISSNIALIFILPTATHSTRISLICHYRRNANAFATVESVICFHIHNGLCWPVVHYSVEHFHSIRLMFFRVPNNPADRLNWIPSATTTQMVNVAMLKEMHGLAFGSPLASIFSFIFVCHANPWSIYHALVNLSCFQPRFLLSFFRSITYMSCCESECVFLVWERERRKERVSIYETQKI